MVELVENELDEVIYINLVENSQQPNLLVRALIILKKENLLAQKYIEFISNLDPIQPYPLVKAIILESLKKIIYYQMNFLKVAKTIATYFHLKVLLPFYRKNLDTYKNIFHI
jgi:hypothetical protein